MDEKFYKRYESFCHSLDSLGEAKERDLSDSFVLSGTGAKFCITFDLSWKIMKDIVTQIYMVSDFIAGSPRDVLRKSFELGMIEEDAGWLGMLRLRNTLSHDYDGEVIAQACDKIITIYINSFEEFRGKVEGLLKNENQ